MQRTLEMGVEDTGCLIDRLAQDCGPSQDIRELTQNAIQAITRAGRERGLIVWGYDQLTYETTGVKKLCVTDNGCGMTGDEQVLYVNNLAAGRAERGSDKNYGIGAKISTITKNHEGVEYLSWKDGLGTSTCLWRDPNTGNYGLRPIPGESVEYVGETPPELLGSEQFKNIAEHGSGTHVILHGQSDTEDTFNRRATDDSGKKNPGRWVQKYLNTRYFRLPPHIRIDCVTAGASEESRAVTGQGMVLDAIAGDKKGRVQLKNAVAFWWIVPVAESDIEPVRLAGNKPISSMKTFSPGYNTAGHVAAIFQDELHDTIRGNHGRSILQQFGVLVGYERVVIYVEPIGSGVTPNIARTALFVDKEPLPWGDWAEEFRAKLPAAIKGLMASIRPKEYDSKKEDERIRSVMDLYKSPKYKLETKGSLAIANADAGFRKGDGGSGPDGRVRPEKLALPRRGSVYSSLLNASGRRGNELVSLEDLPTLTWVSAEHVPRSRPPETHPNHAAWFVGPNSIQANEDFDGFRALIEKLSAHYPGNDIAKGIVMQVVRSWWGQTLKECVQGMRGLVASGVWSKAELAQMLADDEQGAVLLTAAVMPKYLLHQAMLREISGRLSGSHAVPTAAE